MSTSADTEIEEPELSRDFPEGDLLPPSLSYTPSDPLSRSSSFSSTTSSWDAATATATTEQSLLSSSSSSSSSRRTDSSSYRDLAELGEAMNDYRFSHYYDYDPLHSEPDFDYYWQTSSPDATLYEPDAKSHSRSRSRSCSRSRSPDIGRTPYPSLYDTHDESLDTSDASVEPGSSASTIRSSLHDMMMGAVKEMENARPESTLLPVKKYLEDEDEMVDGNGWDGGHGGGRRGYRDDWDYRRGDDKRGGGGGDGGGGGRRDGNNGRNYGGGGGGGRDRDGDDGKGRRPTGLSTFSSPTESDVEEEEENANAADPVIIPDSTSGISTGTDDDVPLAQRIPTALKAQKTIRKQVRDERDQRRRERAATRERERELGASATAGFPRSRQMTYPPPAAAPPSSYHHEASRPIVGRPRTKTMPSATTRPFAIDDLTKKLLNVQATGSPPPAAMAHFRYPQGIDNNNGNNDYSNGSASQDDLAKRLLNVQAAGSSGVASGSQSRSSQGRDWRQQQQQQQRTSASAIDQAGYEQPSRPSMEAPSRVVNLRPAKSLHSQAGKVSQAPESAHLTNGSSTQQRVGRSVTTAIRSRRRVEDAFARPSKKSGSVPPTTRTNDALCISGTDKSTRSYKANEEGGRPFNGGYLSASSRVSLDNEGGGSGGGRGTSPSRRDTSRYPVPAMPVSIPPAEALSNLAYQSASKTQMMTQQRIFIGDKQRFNMVEIDASTNAGEVVEMVYNQAVLGGGGWMLWEVAQDFGMGRCSIM